LIDLLKVWITNITIAVFFITAVEMILPDNSMKKYAKFVLGLLLIVVIINPIIKIFDKNFDLGSYSSKATSYMESKDSQSNIQKFKDSNIANTTENFKKNLETECIANLEEAYPENKYDADVDIVYDSKNQIFNINSVQIEIVEGGISNIKNIEINTESVSAPRKKIILSEQGNKIKKLISNKFKINDDIITVFKSDS